MGLFPRSGCPSKKGFIGQPSALGAKRARDYAVRQSDRTRIEFAEPPTASAAPHDQLAIVPLYSLGKVFFKSVDELLAILDRPIPPSTLASDVKRSRTMVRCVQRAVLVGASRQIGAELPFAKIASTGKSSKLLIASRDPAARAQT
ncbi:MULTISPECIES: hypothetical protein [unclassified Bradyrhizobium]